MYFNPENSIIDCALYNFSGFKISNLVNEFRSGGKYEEEFDLSEIPPGIYYCVLKTNKGIQTQKLIKL
jgi:hypothetical protein